MLNCDFSFYSGLWGDENCTVSLPCICKHKIPKKIEKEIPKDPNQQGVCPKGWLHFGFKVKPFLMLFHCSKYIPCIGQIVLKDYLIFEDFLAF